jgi:hypothetical protein
MINKTCRWCDGILGKHNKTGLCGSCYLKYRNAAADKEHYLNGMGERKRINPTNTCECGNTKDKRAKRCMECWVKVRDPMIREIGMRSYGAFRRKDSIGATLPASTGRMTHSGRSMHD